MREILIVEVHNLAHSIAIGHQPENSFELHKNFLHAISNRNKYNVVMLLLTHQRGPAYLSFSLMLKTLTT